jgi:hypothetical protein
MEIVNCSINHANDSRLVRVNSSRCSEEVQSLLSVEMTTPTGANVGTKGV